MVISLFAQVDHGCPSYLTKSVLCGLGLEGVLLAGGPLLAPDLLDALGALLGLVEPPPESPGLPGLEVGGLDGLAAVELLELELLGLVHDGQDLGDGLPDGLDLAELVDAAGGDLGNAEGGQLLAVGGELLLEVLTGLAPEGGDAELLP